MPPVLAAIPMALLAAAEAGTVGLPALGIGAGWSAALIAGGSTLAMSGISALLNQPANHVGPTHNAFGTNPNEPRTWCYGRSAIGGSMVYWETVGKNNQDFWAAVLLQDTLIDGVEKFYVNNVYVAFDGNNAATPSNIVLTGCVETAAATIVTVSSTAGLFAGMKVSSGNFDDSTKIFSVDSPTQLRMTHNAVSNNASDTITFKQMTLYCKTDGSTPVMWRYDWSGSDTQSADPYLVAASATGTGYWTTACRLQGQAYFVWHLKYYASYFPTGMPNTLLTVLRGRRIYDPRQDTTYGGGGAQSYADPTTWTWSRNAALCLLDYMLGVKMNGTRIGGVGIPIAALDIPSLIAAANICDQSVSTAAGGTVARYTCDGFVDAIEDKTGVVQAMLTAMDGMLTMRGGVIGLIAGAAQSTVATLIDDDLAGPLTLYTTVSRQEKVNCITSTYAEPAQLYASISAPTLIVPAYETIDGGLRLERNVPHRFTTDLATVQRLNKLALSNYREQLSIDATFKPIAVVISPGDTFLWTSASAGYTSQKMLCMSRDVAENGTVRIIARQETDAKYTWATGEEQNPPTFNANPLLDPTVIDAPLLADIAASSATLDGADNAKIPAILIVANSPPSPFVNKINTQWQLTTETTWHSGPSIVPASPDARTKITGLAPGVLYNVRVSYQSPFAVSDWTQISSVSAGNSLTTTGGGLVTLLDITENPAWLRLGLGTGTGFVKHYTNVLMPESSVGASTLSKAQLWEQYVPSPVTSSIYEITQIDLGATKACALSFPVLAYTDGRGVAGAANVVMQIDYWASGGADPNSWATYTSGTVITARYIRVRLLLTNGSIPAYVSGLEVKTSGAAAGAQYGFAADGTAITFSPAFSVTPNIQMTPTSNATAWITAASNTGFTLHVSGAGSAYWQATEG